MNEVFDRTIDALSERVPRVESEYIAEDGLLHCSVCHGATETLIKHPFTNEPRKVRCICKCKTERDMFNDRMKQEEFNRKRSICFQETNMASWTFENDDRQNEKISDAMMNYVKNFQDFKKEGKGLLLYGTVGTGKTYYASCIANALIDNGYTALFRTFKQIERELWNAEAKAEYMKHLNRYTLLIFDDLGAERDSKYMSDVVFDIIDTRYKSGLPFIVTTNLSADEIKKPEKIEYSRIYDRILERCHPIEVSGVSRRKQKVKDTYSEMNEKLGL